MIGNDLSIPAVVTAMVGNEGKRQAVLKFTGEVMSQKEEHEPTRRGERGGGANERDGDGAILRAL